MNVIVPCYWCHFSHSIYCNLSDRSVLDEGATILSERKLVLWMAVLLVQEHAEAFERRWS